MVKASPTLSSKVLIHLVHHRCSCQGGLSLERVKSHVWAFQSPDFQSRFETHCLNSCYFPSEIERHRDSEHRLIDGLKILESDPTDIERQVELFAQGKAIIENSEDQEMLGKYGPELKAAIRSNWERESAAA